MTLPYLNRAFGPLLLLGACSQAPTEPGPKELASKPSASVPAPMSRPRDAAVPDAVVALFNEPFWRAEVFDGTMRLSGAGVAPFTLSAAPTSAPQGTGWVGEGGGRSATLLVAHAGCADSMSGARYPLRATLLLDGHRVEGCARARDARRPIVPDGQASPTRLPAAFQGRWAANRAGCDDPAHVEALTVAPGELRFHESLARVTEVTALGPAAIRVVARFEGEGERWTDQQNLRLQDGGDVLVVETGGAPLRRVRCD